MLKLARLKYTQRICFDSSIRCRITRLCIIVVMPLLLLALFVLSGQWRNRREGRYESWRSAADTMSYYTLEPIDVVYTWVNGSDPAFIEMVRLHQQQVSPSHRDDLRFRDKNELKYSLRSLAKYAPLVRHIYIVTNGQIPHWLNIEHDGITVVSHADLCSTPGDNNADIATMLPTFSSPAIETLLHLIPSLSRRFLYLNDDIYIGAPIYPDDLYTHSGGVTVFTSYDVPNCADNCPWSYIGDGLCHPLCNTEPCQFDGGDCAANKTLIPSKSSTPNRYKNCLFTSSLVHTNRVLNSVYGFRPRKVIWHVGLMLDRLVVAELLATHRLQFARTRVHRFRHDDDMQFAFAYFHHLMETWVQRNISEIFDEFDTDRSGTWSDGELRKLVTQIYKLPLKEGVVPFFENLITNCTVANEQEQQQQYQNISTTVVPPDYGRYHNSSIPHFTKAFIVQCPLLVDALLERFGRRPKYQFTVSTNTYKFSNFKMLTSNVTKVVETLDQLRQYPKKFNCINDNLDANFDNSILDLLEEFYVSSFPAASPFELPPDHCNRFTNLDAYRVWRQRHWTRTAWTVTGWLLAAIICGCVLRMLCFCWRAKRLTQIVV